MIEFQSTRHSPEGMTFHCGDDSHVGFIPGFLDPGDPRSAKEQINDRYGRFGGWRATTGFTASEDGLTLTYPGDPPRHAWAEAQLGDEIIRFYRGAWIGIFQSDGSFEVARCD